MTAKNHWEDVCGRNNATSLSWHASHLTKSHHFVRHTAPEKAAAIIEVGVGGSTPVDDLLRIVEKADRAQHL